MKKILSCVVVMLAAFLIIPDMTTERKLAFMLAILLPLHVFEENTWPRGFHYMMNLVQKSDRPDAGPMPQKGRLLMMFTMMRPKPSVIMAR